VPGSVLSNAEVCSGFNLTTLQLTGNTGNVLNWIGSTNGGQSWTPIQVQTSSYNATNLDSTTIFEAVVQHGFSCAIDSSSPSTIQVDPKSIGGNLLPVNSAYCLNQPINTLLQLNNHVGNIVTWQSSLDSINWSDFPDTDTSYLVNSLPATIHYRTIVKSGVCPLDTSQIANIYLYPAAFPQASIDPADTTICFGTSALLNADISIGTTYFWVAYDSLSGAVSGTIPSDPALVSASALPSQTADYVLEVENPGCPNALADTFLVNVIPPIKVSIVQDTSVVVGEPLQFNAISSDTAQDVWLWSPSSYLNNPDIPNPVARYGGETDSITYIVRATDAYSCYGQSTVSVKIYKTLPDIFVPTGFTPGQGVDNMFRPIPVGISKLNYFRVYNRWGQLVYETTQMGAGWNGIYKGRPQDSATFVWEVAGVDYLGNTIAKKGTVVLIR
jgi:gliding motility-associated-like protein